MLYYVTFFKDPSPLEVYGTEFFVDGSQLGFLGKIRLISFKLFSCLVAESPDISRKILSPHAAEYNV